MQALRKMLAGAMVVIQHVLAAIGMLLRAPTFILHALPHLWKVHVYYGWTKLRRRVAGEPVWKEIDALIGIYPPKDHPWWDEQPAIVGPPGYAEVHAELAKMDKDPPPEPPGAA